MYLSKQEKELISIEIKNIEKFSSAELVAIITKRSSDYKYVISLISVFTTFFLSFLLKFSTHLTILELISYQILIFLSTLFLLERFDNLVLKFLPKIYKRQKASQNAKKQFYNLGLNRTKTKQAIMFFVSIDEKYVEILSDSEISKKIKNEYWELVIEEFTKDVKNHHLSNGFLKAIQSCSETLITNFPIKANDINELPDEVIELK